MGEAGPRAPIFVEVKEEHWGSASREPRGPLPLRTPRAPVFSEMKAPVEGCVLGAQAMWTGNVDRNCGQVMWTGNVDRNAPGVCASRVHQALWTGPSDWTWADPILLETQGRCRWGRKAA